MAYTKEDLPAAVQLAKDTILALGRDIEQFEIEALESGPCVRVACHSDRGGFMVRLFNDRHISDLQKEIIALFSPSSN